MYSSLYVHIYNFTATYLVVQRFLTAKWMTFVLHLGSKTLTFSSLSCSPEVGSKVPPPPYIGLFNPVALTLVELFSWHTTLLLSQTR